MSEKRLRMELDPDSMTWVFRARGGRIEDAPRHLAASEGAWEESYAIPTEARRRVWDNLLANPYEENEG